MNSIATRHAPDVKLPLAHIFTGIAAALLGGVALLLWAPELLARPVGDFRTLAVTHLFTLGWLAMTITGASYQLIPVVLEVRLRSEPLARVGYVALCLGVAGMIAGFWGAAVGLLAAGAVLAAAALLTYAAHIAATCLQAGAHRMHRLFFLGATVFLVVVCVLGALMAVGFRLRFSPGNLFLAHITAAVLGWASLFAMGVAYKLVPMFALSHGHGEGRGTAVFSLTFSGAALLVVGAALQWSAPAMAAAGLLPLAAVGLFLWDQWMFFRLRHKPRLDVGLRLTTIACGYLGLTAAVTWLALAGLWRPAHGVPVILALLGWLGCLLSGQTYKIVPFLVWFHRYASRAGREKVPLLRDMYDERLAAAGMWGLAAAGLLMAAGAATGTGALERLSALAWLVGYAILAANMFQVLRA